VSARVFHFSLFKLAKFATKQIPILERFKEGETLKVLHLSQSMSNRRGWRFRGLPEDREPSLAAPDNVPALNTFVASFRPTQELYELAKWAFGPDGLPSLEFIALGDWLGGTGIGDECMLMIIPGRDGLMLVDMDSLEDMVGEEIDEEVFEEVVRLVIEYDAALIAGSLA